MTIKTFPLPFAKELFLFLVQKRAIYILLCREVIFQLQNLEEKKEKEELTFPANTLRKSNAILRLYFGNLRKLLSANVDDT